MLQKLEDTSIEFESVQFTIVLSEYQTIWVVKMSKHNLHLKSRMIHYRSLYEAPPQGGCPITQSRKFFSIFTASRTYFPAFTQSYKLVKFFHSHAITHIFFPISRNHANNANEKGLFTPSRTPKRPFTHHAHMSVSRNHAIIFTFSRNHAKSRNKKGPFTQSRKPMGGGGLLYS